MRSVCPEEAVHGSDRGSAPASPAIRDRFVDSRSLHIDHSHAREIERGEAIATTRPSQVERRRVALITGNYDSVPDGVSRTLVRLAHYLIRHETAVLVVGPPRLGQEDQVPYVAVPSLPIPGRPEYRLALGLPRAARARLAAFEPDVVHVATPDLLGFQAQRWALERGIPAVSSYHTHFPSYLSYYGADLLEPVLERYLAWFYRRCRHVYVPTPAIGDYARELGLDGRVRAWGRGVDCTRFSPAWRSESWRAAHGIESDEIVVTFVGRLVKEKGLSVFADIVDALSRASEPIKTVVVGDGPLQQHLRDRLVSTVFTGHIEGDDLARAYASSDVFLFPSDTEAFGNVVVEAMASGLAVVAANSLASRCHIRHGENGVLVTPGCVDEFQHETLRLARDADARRRLAFQARRDAAKYDWEAVLARLVEYYDELIVRPEPTA